MSRQCGCSTKALGNYLHRYWHELVLHRCQITMESKKPRSIRISSTEKQNLVTLEKGRGSVQLDLNDHIHRDVRQISVEQYAEAVELYRTTDMTIEQVADLCRVSPRGFSQHLRFYHKKVLQQKKAERQQAQREQRKIRGVHSSNGRCNAPFSTTERKYAKALALYRDTCLTMKEIAHQTGVPKEGFRSYLHKWHKELVLELRALPPLRMKPSTCEKRGAG